MYLNLKEVPEEKHDLANDAFHRKDAKRFIALADETSVGSQIALVVDNSQQLRETEIYEAALLAAFTGRRLHRIWPTERLTELFRRANRAKLRACGPDGASKIGELYRGTAGKPNERRDRGFSWTTSLDCACWYALREPGAINPQIRLGQVSPESVLCFTSTIDEEEYIVLPDDVKDGSLCHHQMIPDEMKQRAVAYAKRHGLHFPVTE